MIMRDKEGDRKSTDHLYFKASYTVEGSFIISFVLIILMSLIMLSYTIFYESEKYIKDVDIMEYDAVKCFRTVKAGQNFVGALKKERQR